MKLLLGRKELDEIGTWWPFAIKFSPTAHIDIMFDNIQKKQIRTELVCALLLEQLKSSEEFGAETAVITIPPNSDSAQRQILMNSASIANLCAVHLYITRSISRGSRIHPQ